MNAATTTASAAGLAAACVQILVWAMGAIWHITVPTEMEPALITVAAALGHLGAQGAGRLLAKSPDKAPVPAALPAPTPPTTLPT